MDRKISKLCMKDFVMDNSSRLKSIRIPRDLSLGGSKLRKGKYKPNLNVTRNKNRSQNDSSRIEKSNLRPRMVEDKLKKMFVQSTGVFFEGSGPSSTPYIKKEIGKSKSENNHKPILPTVNKEDLEVDSDLEKSVYRDIIGSQSSSDSESDEKPPFRPIEWGDLMTFVKQESELELSDCISPIPKINLWQMPKSLPFQKGSSKTTPVDLSLTRLPLGKIGKILIRKSGKTEAVFGNAKFLFHSVGAELEPYQTFVSLNIGPEKNEALVLGEVDCSYMILPDFSFLFGK